MSYNEGDMVKLTQEAAAYATRELDEKVFDELIGVVIKSRKREVHAEAARGLRTHIKVVDMVEVMWNNGTMQKVDGRWLEKITARTAALEGKKNERQD